MSSQTLTLGLKRNPVWKPNGPMDYARSARKWNIGPTEQTAFFVHENKLMRRTEHHHKHEHHHSEQQDGTTVGTEPTSGGGTKATSGTEVPAQDVQNDLEYVVPVAIGTPAVTLNLDFDTGSSDLWVWSSLLPSSVSKTGHTVYNPTKSTTAKKDSGLTWNISYGDGSSASGSVYSDTITLGGNLSVPNQAVEVAQKLSSAFTSENGSDGLLGLAFPAINTVSPTQQATPVENMINQSLISQPLFTVKLDKGDSEGFYTFGYIDTSVTSNPITYATIDSSNGFWEFSSPTVTINGKKQNRASGNTAIADTGTTLILVDDATCKAIYGSIKGAKLDNSQGGWVIPNTVDASTLPEIGFAVEGTTYTIPGSDLIFADSGNGTSFGSVQSRGQNPQDILGDVFLKRVYAIFEQTPGAPRIGFAQR
ncbi:acid protease [Clavulina sp. PMI_390]|nr:acid protease [Clavulina sp. PMI_390]